jgi:hypothetical protein
MEAFCSAAAGRAVGVFALALFVVFGLSGLGVPIVLRVRQTVVGRLVLTGATIGMVAVAGLLFVGC